MTIRLFLLLVVLAASPARADLGDPGPYAGGWRTVTVTRGNGTTFTARLYYPALAAGQNTAINPAGGPYPGVSFGHGFLQAVGTYQSTLVHLATHGFVVIASESEGGLFPSHANFAADLSWCLTYLEQQNTTAGTLLHGLIDPGRLGMSGHSMGGGASVLAAAGDARVKALVPLAAAQTNPSAVAAAPNLRAATLYIVGSQDSIVLPAQTQTISDPTPPPAQFASIFGGFHCGFIDSQGFGCDSGSTTRAVQLRYTRRLMTEFFSLHLKGDQSLWDTVWWTLNEPDPGVTITRRPDSSPTPDRIDLLMRAGQRMAVTISVRNTGPTARGFTVRGEGAWAWVTYPTGVGSLPPNASADLNVVFAPPVNLLAGSGLCNLTVISGADGATRSVVPILVEVLCAADLNRDGVVDFNDYLEFLNQFNAEDPEVDMNLDGVVDFNDYLEFLNRYNRPC